MGSRFALRFAFAALLALALPGAAVADEEEMGMGGMGGMHGGMQSGASPSDPNAAQTDVRAQMQRLREHTRMMDGVRDQHQLMMEMQVHMRMVDDMMESVMNQVTPGAAGTSSMQQPMPME